MIRFWFAPESPRPLALMRILLGLALLLDCVPRWPHVVEMYSSAGTPLPLHPETVLHPLELPPAETALLYAGLLFALVCVVLGWWTRLSLVAAAALLAWFGLLDFAGTMKKYTVIGIHLLVLSAFSRCAAVWSLDRLFDSRRDRRVSLSPAWPRRLMQILFCAVYVGAATTKFRTSDFATGDLLYFSLLDLRWGGEWLGLWLVAHPKLLVVSSYATLLFETAFPLLVWMPRMRRPLLLAAVLFHSSMALVMTLAVFTPVMLAALCAFLEERDLVWLRRFGRSESRRDIASPRSAASVGPTISRVLARHALNGVAFLTAGAAFVGAGFAHQRSADWYGVFRGAPPEPLIEIDEATFNERMAGVTPRNAEYVYRVELGERISTHHAFGASSRFRVDERAWLLVRLIRPHPGMRLELELAATDGSFNREEVHFAPPEIAYLFFPFDFTDEHPPGDYEIVVKSNGFVAARKPFELLPAE
ncbi:MAG: HTTM domain-containing protein [Planctomycetaceae bacterium]